MDSDTNGRKDSILVQNDAKKVFRKLGTCSQAFFHILNREFGHPKEAAEQAADPFAGGIMQKGYQCGMLWGSSLAVGAESFRRFEDSDEAIGVAIRATQYLLRSFLNKAKNVACLEITNCDWTSKWSVAKHFISGRFRYCYKLAEKWAPEAIEASSQGLSNGQADIPEHPRSCASEVAKKMGASDEEMVSVAGFAGGLGLSGNACGALCAAIWMNTLAFNRGHDRKAVFLNPKAKNTLEAFEAATDSEMVCHKICGKWFKTIEDHTEYIKNGGCNNLINVLARS